MSWIKIIAINIFVILALIGGALLLPPLYGAYLYLKPKKPPAINPRARLALYENYDWAAKHFEELSQLSSLYYDFIGWRRRDFAGDTITVKDGTRRTVGNATPSSDRYFWFFGGSTTWGTGVNDGFTYPSIFARKSGATARNFGESSYMARQSLAYLTNLFVVHKGDAQLAKSHIVFYDGVNDVHYGCQKERQVFETSRAAYIRDALVAARKESSFKWSPMRVFGQLQDFLLAVKRQLIGAKTEDKSSNYYECAHNLDRAHEVAEHLVETWRVARDLAQARGAKFTAILQPVAFIGSPKVDYLNRVPHAPNLINLNTQWALNLAEQYKAVYPIIRELAQASDLDFVDLTAIYDGCDNCYIDYCHVGPQAHEGLGSALRAHLIK